ATHRPLEQMALRGEFRSDLLARLSGYRHLLEPLRRRSEDIGLLIGDLLQRSEVPAAVELRFSAAAGRSLLRYPWLLNIRELQQCLWGGAALAKNGVIEREHLPIATSDSSAAHAALSPEELRDPEALRRTLIELFEKHQGKVSHVARDMGKARMQIHR